MRSSCNSGRKGAEAAGPRFVKLSFRRKAQADQLSWKRNTDPISAFLIQELSLGAAVGCLCSTVATIHHLLVTAPQERECNHTVAAEVIRLVNVLFTKVRDIRQRAAYRTPAAGYHHMVRCRTA